MTALGAGRAWSLASSRIDAVAAWWLASLALLLPASVRRRIETASQPIELQYTADGWCLIGTVSARRHREEMGEGRTGTPLTSLPASYLQRLVSSRRPILLSIPADDYLVGRTTLPRSAQSRLAQVMRHEIERLTPFSVDQVVYDCCVVSEADYDHSITVEYALVTRATIDRWLGELREWSLPVWQLRLGLGTTNRDPLRMLRSSSASSRWLMAHATAGAVLVLLLWTTATSWVAMREDQARTLEREVAALRRTVLRGEQLREELAVRSTEITRLESRRTRLGEIDVLAELTAMLTDDEWITVLSLSGERVRAAGVAPSAAAVLLRLGRSEILRDVEYAAPVTRGPGDTGERFEVSGRIRSAAEP